MPAPDAVVDDADRLGDGHRAIAGRIEHVDLAAGGGLGEREGKSPARCYNAHPPLSVPFPETQVPFGPACAGAAERPQARSAPAMACNDVILVDIDVIPVEQRHIFYRLLSASIR